MVVRADVKVLVDASDSVFRRCDGPGRGELFAAAEGGSVMSTAGCVVEAHG